MMDSLFLSISRQLSASSLVLFVDLCALGAVDAAKVASDYDSDGDTDRQPDRNVAGGDPHRGADPGAESDAKNDLHWLLHVSSTVFGNGWDGRNARPPLRLLLPGCDGWRQSVWL
jgi:hypothetical protein